MIRTIVVAALLAAALPAAAQPSPRWGTFELSLGAYKPNIDSEFAGTGYTPYQTVFGGSGLMFRADVAKSLYTGVFGEVDLGFGAGWFSKSGHGFETQSGGLQPDPTRPSSDDTTFRIIPTRASLTYRLDYGAEHLGIPLVPYIRASFDHYFWWVNGGTGDTSSYQGQNGSGATNGYSFSGGVQFQLDFLDPTLAREFDRDSGVNHTYLFADFTKSYIDDFGSKQSWNLSNDGIAISGGLLFAF